jgi:hypothetical protein
MVLFHQIEYGYECLDIGVLAAGGMEYFKENHLMKTHVD